MILSLIEALAEADVEAACRRLGLGDFNAQLVLVGYRVRGRLLLAASVLSHAMAFQQHNQDHPSARDAEATERGANCFVSMRVTEPAGGHPVPDDSHDWRGSVARECDRLGLSPADRSYVLSRLAVDGWRVVAAWVELSAGTTARPAVMGVPWTIRSGCYYYAESRIWLRDRPPAGLPLSIYAAAG